MFDADVLIVGAGPAGAALAVALTQLPGLRVVMVERDTASTRFGETLPGAARALLRDLGVLAAFEADGHGLSLGQASMWGDAQLQRRDAFVDPQGPAWRIDRARLQARLVATALAQGCQWRRHAAVSYVQREHTEPLGWRVGCTDSAIPLRCRFIVDASGRRAALARQLGQRPQRLDRLVCDTLLLDVQDSALAAADGADLEGFSLIEAQPEGWFYGTQLASGQRLIAWHCDHDLAAAGQRRNLMARIHASTLMRRFAQGMAARTAPLRVAAWSARLPQLAGAGWAAVGDAACSFDPLSSQGLFSALYAGLRLANALHANDHALRSEAYATEMDDVWAAYLQHHRRYYASEPRWPEQAFWQRRLTSVRG